MSVEAPKNEASKSEAQASARSVTLADLAKAAGVSRTTASNAFNRPDQLSVVLRERILATAQTLNYPGPNPMARMLRTGRAGALGLVFADSIPYAFSDPASLALLRGVGEICEREHEAIAILPVEHDVGVPPAVHTAAVDGFLVYCVPEDAPVLKALEERGLPVVGIDQHGFALGPSVIIDDEAAALEACRHLTALGHYQFGVLSLDLTNNSRTGLIKPQAIDQIEFAVSRKRLRGYFRGLEEVGLEPFDQLLAEIAFNSVDAAEQVVRSWLQGTRPPTAVLAMSDQVALGAMRAAADLGVLIPHQLSIVGFDDTDQAMIATPPLTTVHQPIVEKGRLATTLLLEARRHGVHCLAAELVVRGTTAPPPS
ncbi:MAG: LacI family DNA-binding transcriptional regulator [Pseudomonadota bacterium]